MRSILDIVRYINASLQHLFPDGKIYGIAMTAYREGGVLPAEGDTYIGVDDSYPVQIYHKINGLTIARQTQGFGDKVDQLYTYQMAMYVFLNKPSFRPEDLIPVLQESLPQQFKTDYTKRVSINFLSAILNDKQIYTEEYGNAPYRLSSEQRLFRINYSLEVLYKPGCFNVCPEDLKCKN